MKTITLSDGAIETLKELLGERLEEHQLAFRATNDHTEDMAAGQIEGYLNELNDALQEEKWYHPN